MADAYLSSPRRMTVQIKLHCGELVSIVLQDSILKEMTEEELEKVSFATTAELQSRQPQPERNDADNTA
jgi:hypothetical protein